MFFIAKPVWLADHYNTCKLLYYWLAISWDLAVFILEIDYFNS